MAIPFTPARPLLTRHIRGRKIKVRYYDKRCAFAFFVCPEWAEWGSLHTQVFELTRGELDMLRESTEDWHADIKEAAKQRARFANMKQLEQELEPDTLVEELPAPASEEPSNGEG